MPAKCRVKIPLRDLLCKYGLIPAALFTGGSCMAGPARPTRCSGAVPGSIYREGR